MSVFKITPKALEKKSKSILNVFKNTVTDLNKVNTAIFAETLRKSEEIAKLEAETEELTTLHKANSKIVDKINQFLS
jgi:hypothetical protein